MAWLTLVLTEAETAPDLIQTEGLAVVTELSDRDRSLPLIDFVMRITMPMTARILEHQETDAD